MKQFARIALAIALVVPLAAQEPSILLFPGIGNSLGGEEGVDATFVEDSLYMDMDDQIAYVDERYGNLTRQIVIGHSQGGLRGLAYASAPRASDNVEAVITIGAPARGFSPLARGRQVLAQDVRDIVTVLEEGWDAAGKAGVTEWIYDAVDLKSVEDALGLNDAGSPVGALFSLLEGPSASYEATSLDDMTPGSEFLSAYVGVSAGVLTPVMVQTPNESGALPRIVTDARGVPRARFGGPAAEAGTIYWIPAQTGISGSSVGTSQVRNPEVPVGFIVGQESDPLQMASEFLSPAQFFLARAAIANTPEVFGLAESAYQWRANYAGMRERTSIRKSQRRKWRDKRRRADDRRRECRDARRFMDNYESRYGDLLGSRANDGFIPEPDQAYEEWAAMGGTVIDSLRPVVRVPDAHHLNETRHDDIWGPTGSMGSETIDDGVLREWLWILTGNTDQRIFSGDKAQ